MCVDNVFMYVNLHDNYESVRYYFTVHNTYCCNVRSQGVLASDYCPVPDDVE